MPRLMRVAYRWRLSQRSFPGNRSPAIVTLALLVLLKITVTVIVFGIGLDSTLRDAMRLFRHPGLLVRSVLAMYVLVPLAAVALVKMLPLAPGVEAGLLVLAVSAGAPLLPRKLLGIGDGAYIFSLVVISSVLAIVLVPVWLALLGPLFPRLPPLAPERAAMVLAESFFLPLLLGMAIRWLFPKAAAWTAGRLVGLAGIVLAVSALALLAVHWYVVLEARWKRTPARRSPSPAPPATSASPCWSRHRCRARAPPSSSPSTLPCRWRSRFPTYAGGGPFQCADRRLSSRPVRPSRRRPAVRRRRRRRGRAGRRQRPSPPRRSGG